MTAGLSTGAALANLEVRLVVGGALRVDANLIRLGAERLALDTRSAALGTHGALSLDGLIAHAGGQRIGDITVRPTHAANEAATGLGARLDNEVFAALGAGAHAGVGRDGIGNRFAEVILVLDKRVEHAGEQRARVVDDLILSVGALGDLRHVLLELTRHVRCRDARSELVKGVDDGHAKLTRLNRIVLEVLDRIEALDDARARRLGAKAALLHLLDELALAVARRRLRLLGLEVDAEDIDGVTFRKLGKLLVLLETKRIDGAEARVLEDIAARLEGLARNINHELSPLDGRGIRERREETARNEVVELPRGRLELAGVSHAGGIDGWVVRVKLLAARSMHLRRRRELGHVGRILRNAREHLCRRPQVEGRRIDGVVNARIRDEAVHVEALGKAHGTRRRKALGRGSSLKARRVERRGRTLRAALLRHRGDGTRGCVLHVTVRLGRLGLDRKATLGMGDLKALVLRGTNSRSLAVDDPVVLWNEGEALALALDHEGERRRLHTTSATDVAKAAKARHREIAREGGTPDEVDVLAGLAGVSEVLVKLHKVSEGVLNLRSRIGRIASARHGNVRVHLEHLRKSVRPDELSLAVKVRADDDGIRLLGQVLEGANDALLRRKLLDGGPDEIGQARNLPALDVDAILEEGLLFLEWRTREAIRNVSRQHLSLLGDGVPALGVRELELSGEIRSKDVASQANRHPLLAITLEAIDRRVVDLVLLGLPDLRKQGGDLLGGVVLLCDDELHGLILVELVLGVLVSRPLERLLAIARDQDATRDEERGLVQDDNGSEHKEHRDGAGVGRNHGGGNKQADIDGTPVAAQVLIRDKVEDREVEDHQRQLEGGTKAKLEEHDDVDVVLGVGKDGREVDRLVEHPAKGRLQDDEVAEHHAEEEQEDHSGDRGHDPLLLARLKRRHEEAKHLEDDDRAARNDGEECRDLESQREAAKGGGHVKLATVRHELANRVDEQLDERRGRHVDDTGGHKHARDDDGEAPPQLAQVVEQRHSCRSDGHLGVLSVIKVKVIVIIVVKAIEGLDGGGGRLGLGSRLDLGRRRLESDLGGSIGVSGRGGCLLCGGLLGGETGATLGEGLRRLSGCDLLLRHVLVLGLGLRGGLASRGLGDVLDRVDDLGLDDLGHALLRGTELTQGTADGAPHAG